MVHLLHRLYGVDAPGMLYSLLLYRRTTEQRNSGLYSYRTSPPLPFPSLSFPSLFFLLPFPSPFPTLESLGERCKLPIEVWGGATAEIEFSAF